MSKWLQRGSQACWIRWWVTKYMSSVQRRGSCRTDQRTYLRITLVPWTLNWLCPVIISFKLHLCWRKIMHVHFVGCHRESIHYLLCMYCMYIDIWCIWSKRMTMVQLLSCCRQLLLYSWLSSHSVHWVHKGWPREISTGTSGASSG